MSESCDPFDRSAGLPRAAPTPEEQWAQRLLDARREAEVHAEMALVFLETLTRTLGEDKALYLTAMIWRSS